jgi:hypothetical protein
LSPRRPAARAFPRLPRSAAVTICTWFTPGLHLLLNLKGVPEAATPRSRPRYRPLLAAVPAAGRRLGHRAPRLSGGICPDLASPRSLNVLIQLFARGDLSELGELATCSSCSELIHSSLAASHTQWLSVLSDVTSEFVLSRAAANSLESDSDCQGPVGSTGTGGRHSRVRLPRW